MKICNLSGSLSMLLLATWLPNASAFTFIASQKASVLNNSLVFQIDIPGKSESGISWNDSFDRAVHQWSMLTAVQVSTLRAPSNPCNNTFDRISGVGFADNMCKSPESGLRGELANATRWVTTSQKITEVDIIFNNNFLWDVYTGEQQTRTSYNAYGYPTTFPVYDFERTALHEIGHGLGLGHSMFPRSMLAQGDNRDRNVINPSIDDTCGVNIAHGRPDLCPLVLQHPVTATGKATNALFVGGVSADRGNSYKNVFARTETIDIMATAVVETAHQGKPGRLHAIIELSDGSALMMTDEGFAPWDGSVEVLRANALRTLGAANEIYVLRDFDLRANGINNLGVAVYVGYSLDEEPGEVYYSGTPIQFKVN